MTAIDLTRSQFLIPLLKSMVTGLTQLSSSDSALNQKVYELHHFLSEPAQVDGEALMSLMDSAKDLASSYEIKRGKNTSLVVGLPSIFYSARAELEHMIKSKKLSELPSIGSGKVAQLEVDIERFYKLATNGTE